MSIRQLTVWAWVCDWCGALSEVTRALASLPSEADMRARGWEIRERDYALCPVCAKEHG